MDTWVDSIYAKEIAQTRDPLQMNW